MSTTTSPWTPSPGRTVTPVSPTLLRNIHVAQIALAWPAKAAAERLDYSIDLTAWLADAGDTLATVVYSVAPATDPLDLAAAWQQVAGPMATVFLINGRPNVAYLISALVTTGQGRAATFDIALQMTPDVAMGLLPVAGAPGLTSVVVLPTPIVGDVLSTDDLGNPAWVSLPTIPETIDSGWF